MKSKIGNLVLASILIFFSVAGYSQELTPYQLSLEQAIEMGMQNHQQLKISQAQLEAGRQQFGVSKSDRLPSVSFSANAAYLGDVLILDKDWSKVQTESMPHFGNTFSLQASQLLYKGGVIKKSIEMAELQQQLAALDLIGNQQDIKFLIISNYLDIQKILNQIKVLEQNKALAGQLLDNVTKLYGEDMVTRNELIRADLQIKNMEQAILAAKNNHAILSNQMSYALGLPNTILVIPTESADSTIMVQSLSFYTEIAHGQHPALLAAGKNVEIAQKNIGIQKTNWIPALSAFGGYNMQRPLTSTTPVMDMYSNSWQVGLSLNYDLDNLYKNKRRVNLSKSQAIITQESLTYTQQNVEIGVNSAYLKFQEAKQQVKIADESKKLANENYEIVKSKYLNQLVITAEMTDASNAKLNVELQYADAVINALFQYYNLLKSAGTL
ncbi:MAG: TolC family protein [Tannerella sp.]|nr:TolC family protein [Tannerella sp.]